MIWETNSIPSTEQAEIPGISFQMALMQKGHYRNFHNFRVLF
jgi:hypothetical protein